MTSKIKKAAGVCIDVIVENWKSGREGKIFMIACAIMALWLVYPLFCGGTGNRYEKSCTASACSSPASLVKCYYEAFRDGNVEEYLNCVNYTDDERQEIAKTLADSFNSEKWRESARELYGDVTLGVPQWRGDGRMSVKVAIANREDGGGSNKEWYLVKIGDRWLIDPGMTTNPHEMGL